jgi:acyl-CoA synthetase (AMP-forming)/AMP-acid ligase II
MHVGHFLTRAAQRWPDRPAWLATDTVVTFHDAEARVNQLAHALLALGAERGDRIGMLVPNCPQGLETILAPMKAGMGVVPPTPTSSSTAAGIWRPTRSRRRWTSSRSCRRTRTARFSSASCASGTGRTATAESRERTRVPRRETAAKSRKDDSAAKSKSTRGSKAKRHVGRVTRFDAARGYASLVLDGGKDIFVHFSAVDAQAVAPSRWATWSNLEWSLGPRGPEARHVKILEKSGPKRPGN